MDYNFKTNTDTESQTEKIETVIGGDLNFKTPESETTPTETNTETTTVPETETVTEESNINVEGDNTPSTPSEPNEVEGKPIDRVTETPSTHLDLSDEIVTKYLNEKLGKEIKIEDLSKLTQEPDDEYISKLKEWRDKTGRPIQDWIEYNKDYSTMDTEEVLRIKIKNDYPSLTEEQVELELDNWMILDGIDDETTQSLKELKLAKELPNIRKELQEKALIFGEADPNMLTPEMKQSLDVASEIVSQHDQMIENEKKEKIVLEQTLETLEGLDINLNNDLKLNFKLDTTSKESIKSYVEKSENWYNADGSFNHSALLKDAARIVNFDKIMNMVLEQGINMGIEKTLKSSNNSNVNTPNPSTQTNAGKGPRIEGLEDLIPNKIRFK